MEGSKIDRSESGLIKKYQIFGNMALALTCFLHKADYTNLITQTWLRWVAQYKYSSIYTPHNIYIFQIFICKDFTWWEIIMPFRTFLIWYQ